MLKQTKKGLLAVCNECKKVLTDKLNRPLYFSNEKSFHLHYGYIESKGWRSHVYCDTCHYWLTRLRKESTESVRYNRTWSITLNELKNAVKFAEVYGKNECKVIGIGNNPGNISNNPYVFELDEEYYENHNVSYEKQVSIVDDKDAQWL